MLYTYHRAMRSDTCRCWLHSTSINGGSPASLWAPLQTELSVCNFIAVEPTPRAIISGDVSVCAGGLRLSGPIDYDTREQVPYTFLWIRRHHAQKGYAQSLQTDERRVILNLDVPIKNRCSTTTPDGPPWLRRRPIPRPDPGSTIPN